jgi:hypothetical protein
MKNAYRILVGYQGKRPLDRWEDNIKTNLWEIGYDGRD